ncbi:ABC transporter ATP-binding protein [Halomarina pelagica]|uniref:ABC transporter ATP-binding protein n=1 Tax=Halomarina pelagica TaxID=2961599 RepID=UPI0020C4FA62|nr:ABC transporter ATP-binding protein [Halomarina sp. BND7]
MATVTLNEVTKRYQDVVAVDDMNLDIRDGEFLTLVGPSGCGKSTTMEMIAGLTIPSGGEVHIGDREVTNLPPKDRGVAMVFQNIALFPHMNVYENISFGLRLRDYDKEEIDRRVNRAVETVQLEGMLERMPDELSGGQRQRVAIARAIVRNPDAFLMDEPLANLDAKLRVHMRTELQRLHRELETTTIYVTHDQAEAMTMSDRIAVIDGGQLQQLAPPLTCYNEPANLFVAGFIGSPSMNFVEGVFEGDRFASSTLSVAVDSTVEVPEGTSVTLGVRPEDVYRVEQADDVDSPSDVVQARTDVLEPMGDEIFVTLIVEGEGEEGTELLMSVSPDSDLTEGQQIDVVLDRSKVHLFDTESGEALVHGVTRSPEVAADGGDD